MYVLYLSGIHSIFFSKKDVVNIQKTALVITEQLTSRGLQKAFNNGGMYF